MKNLILIVTALFFWSNSSAQIGLLDSMYVAKISGTSQIGLYHSNNGILEFKDNNGVSNIKLDPAGGITIDDGYFWSFTSTADILGFDVGIAVGTSGDNTNFGVFSNAPIDTVGSVAAYLNGDVNIFGSLYFPSDRTLKKDIQPLENSLSKILALNPTQYEYLEKYKWAGGKQTGLIAQELKEVFPHLVSKKVMLLQNELGEPTGEKQDFQAINYVGLISILVKGMQEQNEIIEAQEDRLQLLENQMNQLMASQQKINKKQSINSFEMEGVILEQNFPNPSRTTTTIICEIPQTMKNAQLVIQSLAGQQISRYEIQSGIEHQIEVNLENIPQGIYVYSIIANGQVLASKKMQIGF